MDFPSTTFKHHQQYQDSLGESEALAHAIALSENEWIQRNEQKERNSETLAKEYQREEELQADYEYASVGQNSQKQFDIDHLDQVYRQQQCQLSSEQNTGAWDCTTCTFRNEPYSRACAACQSSPPPQALTYAKISKLRFGLEIELIVPNGRRDGFTYESLEQQWNISAMGYDNRHCRDDSFRGLTPRIQFHRRNTHQTSMDWQVVPDSSLQGNSPNDLCLELVSPILQGEEGLRQLRVVMERLRSLGISTNSSCGFHVHVDATRGIQQAIPAMATLFGIQKIARSFLALEDAFDLLVGLSWDSAAGDHRRRRANQNRYCRSNRIALGQVSNRQRWDRISSTRNFTQLVNLVSPDRYRKLNLTNIIDRNRESTCEFRNHGGVDDLKEAEAWVRLLLRFCERVSDPSMDDTSIALLSQGCSPKDEVAALFLLLDCPGLEQYFRVERRMFLEERMTNPWTCNTCRKVFQNSRSLAQHETATNHGRFATRRKRQRANHK